MHIWLQVDAPHYRYAPSRSAPAVGALRLVNESRPQGESWHPNHFKYSFQWWCSDPEALGLALLGQKFVRLGKVWFDLVRLGRQVRPGLVHSAGHVTMLAPQCYLTGTR